ncbi:MAG TPA: DUF5658 family protein [Gemmataceae bacterium]|nr:DUF5658 family protein [Gemmataceae bacterium]
MSLRAFHPCKLLLFVALSACDLLLTWRLVEHGGGAVYEANPVAGWWLARHGWAGLAGFKFGIVLLVAGLCAAVSRRRPRAGGRLLLLGCAALAIVVGYSGWLMASVRPAPGADEHDPALAEQGCQLDDQLTQTRAHSQVVRRVTEDLVTERCTLGEAVEQVARSAHAHNPTWLRVLRTYYPDRTEEERVAASLLLNAVSHVREDPYLARQVAWRLESQFRAAFGASPPCDYSALGITLPPLAPKA